MTMHAHENLPGGDTSGGEGFVDIHCHCLPGLDDGPGTMSESLALCRALVDDGIKTVVATPHQLGRFSDCNEAAQVREVVSELNEQLKGNGIELEVLAGGDVRVDERICRLLKDDKILTLADGGKYVLLELPHEVFIDIGALVAELDGMNICVVISHPERHWVLAEQPERMESWFEYSVQLQITAGSVVGDFGSQVQSAARHFLDSGLASFVATDSHDLAGRRPRMSVAFEYISRELGESRARQLCIENPLKILKGQDTAQAGGKWAGHDESRKRF